MIKNIFVLSLMFVAIILFAIDGKFYAEVCRFLPLFLGLYLLYIKEYRLVKILLATSVIVLSFAFCLKYGLHYIAQTCGEEYFQFTKRPINFETSGFPSGHSVCAFLTLGFILNFHRLHYMIIPFGIVAMLVPMSRVISLWHTPFQAISGAIIGLLLGFLVTFLLKSKFS